MKTIRFVVLISLFACLVAPLRIAQAAGDSPWSEILNPDGSVKWSALTDLGVTSDQASWMTITLPGGMVVHLDATYHRYKTASGNILVLPSPATLFFMAMHPQESGLSGAQDMLGNGASILFALIGGSLTPAQLAQLAAKGYTDPREFFQAVIGEQALSFSQPEARQERFGRYKLVRRIGQGGRDKAGFTIGDLVQQFLDAGHAQQRQPVGGLDVGDTDLDRLPGRFHDALHRERRAVGSRARGLEGRRAPGLGPNPRPSGAEGRGVPIERHWRWPRCAPGRRP